MIITQNKNGNDHRFDIILHVPILQQLVFIKGIKWMAYTSYVSLVDTFNKYSSLDCQLSDKHINRSYRTKSGKAEFKETYMIDYIIVEFLNNKITIQHTHVHVRRYAYIHLVNHSVCPRVT